MHHFSGTFLGWHRYYIWVYEQVLRTECGYQGPIPYWDWPKWADAPQDSPIFNGDEYSMGGNGEFIPGRPAVMALPLPIPGTGTNVTVNIETGLGGGCVTSGPFANMTVNLGPKALGYEPAGPDDGLGYNPRCLRRDVGPAVAMKYTNYTVIFGISRTVTRMKDGCAYLWMKIR
jgi:tyrosinase